MKKAKKVLKMLPICLVFCLTLLLGVFLTLPQTKDVYATTINWTQKAPGLYDDDGETLIANWDTVKGYFNTYKYNNDNNNVQLAYDDNTPGNLVIGDLSSEKGFFSRLDYAFYQKPLKTITFLDGFSTSNITTMQAMFKNCSSLKQVNFGSGFDTSKVHSFNEMFYHCDELTTIVGISNWDTNSLEDMGRMFYGCEKLTSLDLHTNTSQNKHIWDVNSVWHISRMFNGCVALANLNITGWNISPGADQFSGIFYLCASLTTLDLNGWVTTSATKMDQMFVGCSSLISISFGNGWDTSNVTSMSEMFCGCSSLVSLSVSNWDVSDVTDFNSMFKNCSSLVSLNLSGWNTSSAEDEGMVEMFYRCSHLTSITFGNNWNTSKLTNLASMFDGCSALTSLNLSGWNTENVEYMDWMFHGCSSLKELDLSNWDVSNVVSMYLMFAGTNLTKLNISEFSYGELGGRGYYRWHSGMPGDNDVDDYVCWWLGMEENDEAAYLALTTFEEKLEFVLDYEYIQWEYYGSEEELAGYNACDGLEAKKDYLSALDYDLEGFCIYDMYYAHNTHIQTIIAPAEVPEITIEPGEEPEYILHLPGDYYFATFDSQGNLTYEKSGGEYVTYNVMTSHVLPAGAVGCAYLLNRAQTNIYGYGSSNVADVAVIGGTNSITTNTNLTVASARTASGNNQAQAVVANVLDVTGTSGQSVTLKVYCEQNPTTNNQIILMSNTGSGWTQASCNASYDSTNKVLTVTSTMPANSSSFAVLSAPQGGSPAPSPTPGTGVRTDLVLSLAISAVLAGVVAVLLTANKKKKYSK